MRMKFLASVCGAALLMSALSANAAGISDEQVTMLVQTTVAAVKQDAPGTLEKINKGEHPYKDKDNAELYAFVLDADVVSRAHPSSGTVGTSLKGAPDANGKMFRDELVANTLKDGKSWVDYHYENPTTKKVEPKKTYCELANGSDKAQYIVCSGKYVE
jgi:signal transduction histidine kinase